MKEALELSGKKSWNGYGWDSVHVQLDQDSQREPLIARGSVSTAALVKGENHPKNYAVPNFGVDSDILDS